MTPDEAWATARSSHFGYPAYAAATAALTAEVDRLRSELLKANADVERLEDMPIPQAWPVCKAPKSRTDDRECDVPYVLRRSLSLSKGWLWLWGRDCKHKRGPVQPYDADGPCGDRTDS